MWSKSQKLFVIIISMVSISLWARTDTSSLLKLDFLSFSNYLQFYFWFLRSVFSARHFFLYLFSLCPYLIPYISVLAQVTSLWNSPWSHVPKTNHITVLPSNHRPSCFPTVRKQGTYFIFTQCQAHFRQPINIDYCLNQLLKNKLGKHFQLSV